MIDEVPFVEREGGKEVFLAAEANPEPNEKQRRAEQEKDATRGRRGPAVYLARIAHQNEERSGRADIVRIKVRVEIGAEDEHRDRRNHPGIPPFADGQQEDEHGEIERWQNEEAVNSENGRAGVQNKAADRRGLWIARGNPNLARGSAGGGALKGSRLHNERGGNAVLVTAKLVGQRGPIAGNGLVLEQQQRDRERHGTIEAAMALRRAPAFAAGSSAERARLPR